MAGVANLFALIDQIKRNVAKNLKDPVGAVELGLLRMDEDFKKDPVNTVLGSANIGGGLLGAITPKTVGALKSMSREEFLGKPKIVGKSDAADLQPIAIKSLGDAEPMPFMNGRFQAKYTPKGSAVFDGDKVIASYNFGDTLVVDPKYRKQGIGEELVYQARTYFPEPAKANTRNKVSQKIQENVFNRIQSDLAGYKPEGGLLNEAPKAPQADALETARKNAVKMLGLPENNTPMDRARALGFSDSDVYHATSKDFDSFDLGMSGSASTITKTEPAIFTSTKPSVSNEFVAGPYFNNNGQVERFYGNGANILPLKIRLEKPEVWEMSGRGYEADFVESAIKEAKRGKVDSVAFKNMRDPGFNTVGRGEASTILATLKPQNLRSRFAAFDPARVNENNLLASRLLPLSIPGLLYAGQEEE